MSDEKQQKEVEERKASDENKDSGKKQNSKSKKPIVYLTWSILMLSILIFYWYVMADRHTPYTDLARVSEIYIPITPRVSGYLEKVNVQLHSHVKQGDVIFELDQRPYLIAVKEAEANLENTIQQLGAQNAGIKSSASSVGVAKAQLDRSQRNYDRVMRIYDKNPGALSQADIDRVETSLNQSIEKLASSEANLEKTKKQMGVNGAENPQLKIAITKLEKTQLDLEFTKLYAEFDGFIESFNVDVGYYSNAGQPLATLVSTQNKWIQADLKENNLAYIAVGDSVNFVLDVAPGKIFTGYIKSIGLGVNAGNTTNKGDLPTVSSSSSWLRDPQRIPVIIEISDSEALKLGRNGGQVDVVVYTGDKGWLNAIGRFQIWLTGKLSYLR